MAVDKIRHTHRSRSWWTFKRFEFETIDQVVNEALNYRSSCNRMRRNCLGTAGMDVAHGMTAVRRLRQVRHQWQIEEPVGQADEDRLKPRPDLWPSTSTGLVHPAMRPRPHRRGTTPGTRGYDSHYPRSCHTEIIARQFAVRYRNTRRRSENRLALNRSTHHRR